MTDDDTRRQRDTSLRRKSEKRQRTAAIYARVTPDEKTAFLVRADKAGMAAAAFARAALVGDSGPRAQRRLPVDSAALRQVLGHLGKTGSNLNQIARYLNTGGGAETVLPDLREALDDLARIRSLIYDALGREPDDAPAASKFIPPPPDT
ncbi:MobC family plasmid mobilization relaxosome protein [Aeromonas sanarellii]